MIRLGLNVDHVATLRNARGEAYPDPIAAARVALDHGADGITAHLREDRRHIRDDDIKRLRELPSPLNFEMAATDEMVEIACRVKPHACCVVPERRQEVTTEGGLAVVEKEDDLRSKVERLLEAGIRVSLFIDPERSAIDAAKRLNVPVVELHTGAYATGGADELRRLQKAADYVTQCGIELHAGHGLTYDNVAPIAALPGLAELNIGHFLISEAVFLGLGPAVHQMKEILARWA